MARSNRIAAVVATIVVVALVVLLASRREGAESVVTAEAEAPEAALQADGSDSRDAAKSPSILTVAAEDGWIEGTVIDADGAPVKGCHVVVDRGTSSRRFTCNDDGTFRTSNLPAGRYTIVGWKDALVSTREGPLDVGPGVPRKGVLLRLEASASLALTIRDASDASTLSKCEVLADALRGSCDHAGRVLLSPLPPGPIAIAIAAPGYAPKQLSIELTRRTKLSVDVALMPGASISGSVVDPEGKPFKGAVVRTAHYSVGGSEAAETFGITDESGHFELAGVGGGRTRVLAASPGFAEASSSEFRLEPGEKRVAVDLVLTTGGAIAGTIARRGGEIISGARVSALRLSDRVVTAVDSSALDGSFRLDGLAPGEYTVVAEAGSARGLAPGVVVQKAEETAVSVILGDDALSGDVVDEAGRPIAGATVTAFSSWGNGLGGAPTTTDAEGKFRIEGLVGRPYRIEARASDRGAAEARNLQPGAAARLVLTSTGRLEGVAMDPEGRGLTDLVVTLLPDDPSVTDGVSARYRVLRLLTPDGRFVVDGLPTGGYLARVGSPGLLVEETGFRLESGRTSHISVRLGRGLTVSGRVLDGEAPVMGCEVGTWRQGSNPAAESVTDSGGGFTLTGVAPGEVGLGVECPGNKVAWLRLGSVTTNRNDVVLRVAPSKHAGEGESGEPDFGGVGMGLGIDRTRNLPVAGNVMEGAPAFLAGIRDGDVIYGIDGWDPKGAKLADVVARIRGPLGTPVILDLLRPSTNVTFRAVAERRRIALN